MISRRRIEEMDVEARYHRERYDLYKAKTHSSRATSATRLQELERRCLGADSRLRAAERENALARQADVSAQPAAMLNRARPREG
jgi:hypothetical protein